LPEDEMGLARTVLAARYGGQPEDFEDAPLGAFEEMAEIAHYEERLRNLGSWEPPAAPR
jgi:hypothetical protein